MSDSINQEVICGLSAIIVFVLIYIHIDNLKKKFSYFQDKGLSNPKPIVIFGNVLTILFSNIVSVRRQWHLNHGKVYGYFWLNDKRLCVADAEVLRQICIKDFDIFVNNQLSIFSNKYQDKFLTHLKDDHWRRVRALMSPTFSSAKIRRMYQLLDECSDHIADHFFQHSSRENLQGINVKDIFHLYTIDAIATCCYGIKLNGNRKGVSNVEMAATRDEFIRDGTLVLNVSMWRVFLGMLLPKFVLDNIPFEVYPTKLYEPIARKAAKMIESRRESGDKFNDYLQCLIEAKLGADDSNIDSQDHHVAKQEDHHASLDSQLESEERKKLVERVTSNKHLGSSITLTDFEILCGAVFFLLVGLETTANLLCTTTYCLAFHPEIQSRLFRELSKIAKKVPGADKKFRFDHDPLISCEYLDAVISESLRFVPPVIAMDRKANRDCYIPKIDFTVPEGMIVDLDYGSIMKDPDYWPNPDTFKPERFLPENRHKIVPGSYCPFGLGPRHCLGMRFALNESKVGLAKLMMNFTFAPTPYKRFPPEIDGHVAMSWIKDPRIRVLTRSNVLD